VTASRGTTTPTILVVDDDDAARTMLVAAFQRQGFGVVAVATAEEALRELDIAATPALVVCDLGLPGMSGLDLAKRIRDGAALGSVRFVLLTGAADDYAGLGNVPTAVDRVVPKPVRLAALMATVRELLER
jgi:CheY-like chemotaxis protein